MVDERKNLIERLAAARPKIAEQLRDARCMVGGCMRAIDRGFVI
jgi:hypothetical protein